MPLVFSTLSYPLEKRPFPGTVHVQTATQVVFDDEQREVVSKASSSDISETGLYVLDLDVLPDGYYHLIKHPDGETITVVVPPGEPPHDGDHQVPGSDPAEYGWWSQLIRVDNPAVPPGVTAGVISVTGSAVNNADPRRPVIDGILPVGGTTGQSLVKASDADQDVEWSDIEGGVTSFATRGGPVVPEAGDYAAFYDGLGAAAAVADNLATEAASRSTADGLRQLLSEKGQPDGYAALGTDGMIPDAQLPAGLARDAEVTAAVAAEASARTAAITAAIAALVNSAPGLMDTLAEIDAALNNDPNFAATMTAALNGKQGVSAQLTALAGLVSAANKLPYFTGAGAASLADFTSFARTMLDDPDAATARTTLGLGDVATHNASEFQPIDPDLTTIAALDATVAGALATDGTGWFRKTYAQLKTALGLVKADVGLGNVDNTSDANKPVSTAQAAADALAAPKTTATIDLVDRTDNTTETVPAGTTTNCSTAGVTKTAPALAGSVGTPPLRWAVKNLAAASITVAYPDQGGAAQSLTVLSGETRTFRQKSTLGWGVESGAVALATLDARYAVLASPAFTGSPTAPTQTAGDNSTKLATTGYVDTASGLLIPKSLVTAKGDLLVATASGVVARHAVGSNDQVFVADSAQADGTKWATPAYVGIGAKSGAYYGPSTVTVGTTAPTLNLLYAKLLIVAKSVPLAQLLAEVTVAGAAGAVGRLGIWADGTDGYPAALILDAGTIDCTTTGVKTVTVAQTLPPGRYWLSYVAQAVTATVRSDSGRDTAMPNTNSGMTAIRQSGVQAAGVTGALPGTFPATLAGSQDVPLVYMKVA